MIMNTLREESLKKLLKQRLKIRQKCFNDFQNFVASLANNVIGFV